MKVSLCTTCKNRLHHLEQTLPYNIEANKQAEFILVDYYSTDGLCEWIRDNLKTEINTGKLTYYRLSKPTDYFCLSHAINIGFKKATGDIVCNIDADNFTGNNFDIHLLEIFNREKIIAESVSGYGLTGRKAYWRKEFIDILGGYDEDFRYGWGYDEIDIRTRAYALGFVSVKFDVNKEGSYIHHGDNERMINSIYLKEKKNIEDKFGIWNSNEIHKTFSDVKIKHGFLKANLYKELGEADLIKNFS